MTNEELCLRYQAGDLKAAEELIAENRAFIHELSVQFSKQYAGLLLESDDYDQEGSMALLRAAEKFDPSKGGFLPLARLAVRNAFIDAIRMVYPHGEVLFSQEDLVSDETIADSGRLQDTARISMQIRSPYDTDPERIYLQKETLEELYAVLYDLTRREQVWIRWRYGFEDGDPHPLAELARRYHLSESRAGSMEKAALLEMKNKLTKESRAYGKEA